MILPNFTKNCMKLRKFWAVGGAHAECAPLNPPLSCIEDTHDPMAMRVISRSNTCCLVV